MRNQNYYGSYSSPAFGSGTLFAQPNNNFNAGQQSLGPLQGSIQRPDDEFEILWLIIIVLLIVVAARA